MYKQRAKYEFSLVRFTHSHNTCGFQIPSVPSHRIYNHSRGRWVLAACRVRVLGLRNIS